MQLILVDLITDHLELLNMTWCMPQCVRIQIDR